MAGKPRDDLPPAPRRRIVPSAGRAIGDGPPPAAAASWLAHCRLFSSLPAESLRLLATCLREQTFAPGDFLLRQGEAGTRLVVVCEGQAEIITSHDAEGRHVLGQVGPGDVVGEMALLTAEPRTADAVAVTPVRARVLPADEFHELARSYPAISVVLSQLVATRLGTAGRDALAGKTLGGYRIVRRLGRGGMAVVYEARETGLERRVALKMMSHRLVYDASAQARFQREADLVASFRHENIIRLFGRFAAFHTWFMVMEFCDGDSLDNLIRRHGRFPEQECRKILGQLARGLLHAHASGVVHRDLKPSNVLVNRAGTVQLSDFGLALTASDRDAPGGPVIVGTPQYMAPEQLAGSDVDHRTDYFGLGCVAWEMLSGTPLVTEARFDDIVRRHANWSAPDVRKHLPDVSPPLFDLLNQCLQKLPVDRQPDLKTVAAWAAPIDPHWLTDSPAA